MPGGRARGAQNNVKTNKITTFKQNNHIQTQRVKTCGVANSRGVDKVWKVKAAQISDILYRITVSVTF